MPCPTTEGEDAVHVIRHDGQDNDFGIGEMAWDSQPSILHTFTEGVEAHDAVDDLAKQACAIAGADGDEIRARGAVIEPRQAGAFANGMPRYGCPP